MRVLVIDGGALGFYTAAALRSRGHDVVRRETTDQTASVDGVDCALICVPTPQGALGYNSRSAVYRAADWLEHCGYRGLVGLRSTCIMGTCDELAKEFPSMTWFSWPELTEAWIDRADETQPSCTVVGWADWVTAGAKAAEARRQILDLTDTANDDPCSLLVEPTTAEFLRYASAAMMAGIAGLIGELAGLARACGVKWNDVVPRVPPLAQLESGVLRDIARDICGSFHSGSFPKDLAALLFHAARDQGVELPILTLVHDEQQRRES